MPFFLAGLLGLILSAAPARAYDLMLMGGLNASPVPWTTGGEVRLELASDPIWATQTYPSFLKGFGPVIGVSVNDDSAIMSYGGVMMDMRFGEQERWHLKSLFGAGGYSRGSGRDLGGPFNFSMGTGLTYAVSDNLAVGLAYRHTSNAGIYRGNPGANSALAVVTWRN